MLWFLAPILEWLWAYEADASIAIESAIDVWRPTMSSRERQRSAEKVAQALADPESDQPQTAILWAATRWFCSIELPRDEHELWNGPPLWRRVQPEPVMVRLECHERDAIYVLAVERLGSIMAETYRSGGEEAIEPGDLHELLDDLAETGSGVVEMRIERVADARRVFRDLADSARHDCAARRACRRILATIEERSGMTTVPRTWP